MARLHFLAVCLLVSACSGGPPSESTGVASTGTPTPETSALEPDTAGATSAPVAIASDAPRVVYGVLLNVSQGDRACYLTLGEDTGEEIDAMGAEMDVLASFDLCGPPDLTGQRVKLTLEPAEVMAMSCEGDPSCPDTETVALAIAMERAE